MPNDALRRKWIRAYKDVARAAVRARRAMRPAAKGMLAAQNARVLFESLLSDLGRERSQRVVRALELVELDGAVEISSGALKSYISKLKNGNLRGTDGPRWKVIQNFVMQLLVTRDKELAAALTDAASAPAEPAVPAAAQSAARARGRAATDAVAELQDAFV